jgi:regulator of protease activity HflC (stomatin/prohibitin superfamily)
MLDGFIRLLEWLGEKWRDYLAPVFIVRTYEAGVLLRLGKYKKDLTEGVNFKIPFIDEIHTVIRTVDTFHVNPVDITTTDAKQVSVEPIVKFEIIDPKKFILDVNDGASNMHDITRGIIADYLTDCEWDEIKKKTTLTAIKNSLKTECDEIGVKVYKIYFGRIVTTKIYTVFKE